MVRRLSVAAAAAAAVALVAIATRADAPAGRYVIANGTVYDTKTKLTWQQASAGASADGGVAGTTWGEASRYCSGLTLVGSGWRLPTVKEISTLLDFGVTADSGAFTLGPSGVITGLDPNSGPFGPAIDLSAFPGTPAASFWTSTVALASASGSSSGIVYLHDPAPYRWIVDFGRDPALNSGGLPGTIHSSEFQSSVPMRAFVRCVR